MTDTAGAVRDCIRFVTEAELVEDGMHLSSDLGMDSLDRFELLTAIEARLGIAGISDDEWGALKTVGDVIRLVGAKVAEAAFAAESDAAA